MTDPISNQVFSTDYQKFVLQKDHCIVKYRQLPPPKPFDVDALTKGKKTPPKKDKKDKKK